MTLTLTAQQIKDVLEEQFAGCHGQSKTATRLMLPSAGFKYGWDGEKACDSRITNVTLTAEGWTEVLVDSRGIVLHSTKTYRVTVNDFMASGGDGFTTFIKGRNRLSGAKDIDATAAFLARHKAPHPPYDPAAVAEDAEAARVLRINSASTVCPTGSNSNPCFDCNRPMRGWLQSSIRRSRILPAPSNLKRIAAISVWPHLPQRLTK